jgi:epoxyqueuosine reductase QueG
MNKEETVKNIFINLTADVCGIAGIERFKDAPEGFHPKDIYEKCESVIVFGKKMPLGSMLVNPRFIYLESMKLLLNELDKIALLGGIKLEELNGIGVPIPSDAPFEYWDEEQKEGRGLISLKHAAELAGLGKIGKNTLLFNKQYGNTLMFGCVLTNIKLASDELFLHPFCPPKCRICIDNCPQEALNNIKIDQKKCREIIYGINKKGYSICNCNKCRVLCPWTNGQRLRYMN